MSRLRAVVIGVACGVGLVLCGGDVMARPTQTAPTASAPDLNALREVTEGNTAFAVDLYRRLAAKPGNQFFSPLSLSSALAMTYAGAGGDTAKQMAQTLHLSADPAKLHRDFSEITRILNAASPDYELAMANALWGQKGEKFLKPFTDTLKTNYAADMNTVDFIHDTESARGAINKWVEQQTKNKITNLLAPGVLDTQTRLVLTNAVYFKGVWMAPFRKEQTRDEVFHLNGGQTVNAPMMNITRKFKYGEGDAYQALEMPYKGGWLSMAIILPKKVDGLAELESSLTSQVIEHSISGLDLKEVIVTVPRFKMSSEFALANTLSEMGMPLAFSGSADFSGMNGKTDLFLSAVVHKAFVDVNEEGTEAAAATGVVVGKMSAALPSQSPPVFRADHPFLFLIRDNRSGSVVFMGRVVDPKS